MDSALERPSQNRCTRNVVLAATVADPLDNKSFHGVLIPSYVSKELEDSYLHSNDNLSLTFNSSRIDALEMWCWRRLLRIPWTAFRTNVSILEELKVKERLSLLCRYESSSSLDT
ncbi:jg5217 [Pararge aegeria aegeria]|uniref:Jg5217 protein n=1 Tax=Pararge aegeria aegeria TaxID=348720 RepID=A0A8S4R0C6_9NEOP|nr:jg5217 [Pararge aegeria aegeria]